MCLHLVQALVTLSVHFCIAAHAPIMPARTPCLFHRYHGMFRTVVYISATCTLYVYISHLH